MKIEQQTALPPIQSFNDFCRGAGWSEVTGWRARQRGWIQTVNIAGRQYVTAEEICRFKSRAVAGEFSKTHKVPRRNAVTATA